MAEKSIVSLGSETEQVEFKKTTAEIKQAIISMVAILNKHGSGDVYFGVKNDGTVTGQDVNDTTLRMLSQSIRNHITPAIYPEITKEEYGGRSVVHVKFEGTEQPYLAYDIPRIRVADEDIVLGQSEYDRMLVDRNDYQSSWERRVSKYTIDDIDMDVFHNYLRKAKEVGRITFKNEDPKSVLTKLDLTDGNNLLNAGAALFVDSGINDLQMAKFATNEKRTFTDIRRQTGSILGLVEVAMHYLIDAMDWRAEFNGKVQRDEIPEVPVDALREAVVNAFAHRHIESGQSIQIMVFKDRIEIYSPGTFPDKITPEEFAEGDKQAIRRNKLITQTLYYSQDMETFATGLKKIKTLCDDTGVKYEFRKEEYGFTVVFMRHCGEGWGWSEYARSRKTNNATNNASDVKTGANGVEVSDDKEKVISCMMSDKNITLSKIAQTTGISRRTLDRVVRELKDEGIVERKGSSRSGYWIVHK